MYVNDILALERDIEEAVERQVEGDQIERSPEVATLLNEMAVSNATRVSSLEELSITLGGGSSRPRHSFVSVLSIFQPTAPSREHFAKHFDGDGLHDVFGEARRASARDVRMHPVTAHHHCRNCGPLA